MPLKIQKHIGIAIGIEVFFVKLQSNCNESQVVNKGFSHGSTVATYSPAGDSPWCTRTVHYKFDSRTVAPGNCNISLYIRSPNVFVKGAVPHSVFLPINYALTAMTIRQMKSHGPLAKFTFSPSKVLPIIK